MHAVLLDNESVHTIGFEDAEGNDIRNSDPNINVSKMYNKNLTTLIKKQGRQPKKQNGYRFQEEIKKLMYGYSDDLNPSDETSELMEQYIIEYLSNICNLVLRRSHRGGHNCMQLGDLIHYMKSDPVKFSMVPQKLEQKIKKDAINRVMSYNQKKD